MMAWGSGSEGILSGSLDAVHGFAGVPISGFSQLADAMPCTILRYTDQELDSILSENYFYYRDVIPAKTYPGTGPGRGYLRHQMPAVRGSGYG